MSEQGAALQKYNQELVKCECLHNELFLKFSKNYTQFHYLYCIENIKRKRSELLASIEKQMQERDRLECTLKDINDKLCATNESLAAKYETKANYDRIIEETETVYMKILESSQVLLTKIRQEASALEQEKSL